MRSPLEPSVLFLQKSGLGGTAGSVLIQPQDRHCAPRCLSFHVCRMGHSKPLLLQAVSTGHVRGEPPR